MRGGLQIPHRLHFGLLKQGEGVQRLQGLPTIVRGLEQAFGASSLSGVLPTWRNLGHRLNLSQQIQPKKIKPQVATHKTFLRHEAIKAGFGAKTANSEQGKFKRL